MYEQARELEALYATRYVSFRNALATVTGSRESARDAVQEAFARALAAPPRRRAEASLAAWVWKTAFRLQLLEAERDPELATALRRLPPRRRLIIFLRYFGDFSYAEIAESCDVSEGTVAATLAQARAELREALEPEGVAR